MASFLPAPLAGSGEALALNDRTLAYLLVPAGEPPRGNSCVGSRFVLRAFVSLRSRSLRKSTEWSRSRDDGGTSSAGRTSGMELPLRPVSGVARPGQSSEDEYHCARALTPVDEPHRDVKLCEVQLAPVLSVGESPAECGAAVQAARVSGGISSKTPESCRTSYRLK